MTGADGYLEVEEQLRRVLSRTPVLAAETVALDDAAGRTLGGDAPATP